MDESSGEPYRRCDSYGAIDGIGYEPFTQTPAKGRESHAGQDASLEIQL
jgi:hypothetical protein